MTDMWNPTEEDYSPAASERQLSFISALLRERDMRAMTDMVRYSLTVRQASGMIEELLSIPKPSTPAASPAGELKPGAYRTADGTVYRAYMNREGSRLLCAEWTADGFEYAGMASRFVKSAERLTLDEASAFGREFGVCCECGRLLTVPASVAAGIGPVCAGKF